MRGYDGVPGDDDNPLTGIDIVASRIGDVTFSIDMRLDNFPEGGWNDTNVVWDFGILATPSFEYFGQNPNNQDVLDGLIEQVNLDGTGLSDYSIGNITVETILEVPWTDTSLFNGRNFFISLGGIGAVDLIGDVSGGRQSSLFKSSGDGAWFVVGDVDGLNNESFDLPVPNVGCCGNTDQILVPDYLELDSAVVNIGNVTVNARQTDGTSDVSGIDFINITTYTSAELPGGTLGVNTDTGNSNYSDSGFSAAPTENPDWDGAVVSIGNVTVNARQTDGTPDVSGIDFIGGDNNNTDFSGLGILSGVRADSADADKGVAIVFLGGAAYTGFVKIGAFNGDDTGMTGNIGDIFITSNRASLFRDDAQFLVDIGTVGPDYMSGIVLSGETGTIQFLPGIAGFGYDANGTQAVILGDDNASTDSEISNYSFDLHDGLNGLNELIVVVVGRNGPEGLVF